jgi:hypothetical protein
MQNQISALSLPEIRDEFREHSVLGPGGDLFQVCDQNGQWLYRSVPLEDANVAIAKPESIPTPRYDTLQIDRHWLRFYSQRIVVNGKPYSVQVAVLMNEAYEALDRFRLILLFATPVLLILASAGGYWLSTQALAPVDDIGHAAQRISIELTPVWRRVAGGCHLNRPIASLVEDAGFRISKMETGYMPGPRPMTFTYEGSARPA